MWIVEPLRVPARQLRIVARVVPEIERRTARDPAAGWFEAETYVDRAVPGMPWAVKRALAWWFIGEDTHRHALDSSLRGARTLHEHGLSLVIGSDAGNWPVIPYQFHAASTHREIELLAEAGLSAADVLAAATRVPARMMGIDGDVGAIEAGKRADLLIVEGDHANDVRALRNIRWTIKDGVARTPAEWMTVGR